MTIVHASAPSTVRNSCAPNCSATNTPIVGASAVAAVNSVKPTIETDSTAGVRGCPLAG